MTEWTWTDEYKFRMRDFLERKGAPIDLDLRFGEEPDDEANVYGWQDYEVQKDVKDGCRWIVPSGAKLYERTYSQFQDTFSDNKDVVGVNVKGCHCACGRYKDIILRFDGSLTEVIRDITGIPAQPVIEL